MLGRSLLLVGLVACGNVQEQPADAGPDVATAGFTITATTANPSVPLEGMSTIALQVVRTGAFTGDVTVAAMSPPTGLSVSSLTIPGADTTGAVIVGATTPLTIGGTVSITLQATGDGVDAQTVTITDAPITGRPGAFDTAFNGTGLVRIGIGGDGGSWDAFDVISEKIVATGHDVESNGVTSTKTVRITADGLVDSTWNAGATVRTTFGSGSGDTSYGRAIGRQNDGRPIAIGFHQPTTGGTNDISVVRYSLTGGTGGADFGDGLGKSLVDLGAEELVEDGLVLSTNAILAVGSRNSQMFVARLTPLGLLDTTFRPPNGYLTATLGTSSSATRIVTDTQERLVVAGSFNAGTDSDVFIHRYTSTGTLDGAFGGNNGVVISGVDSETAVGLAMSGDKILVATNAGTGAGRRFRVRRYATDGTLDMTFGTNGVAELAPTDSAYVPIDMIVMPDGHIAVLANAAGQALVVRFTATGAIDTLFGTSGDGTITVNLGAAGVPSCLGVYSSHLMLIGGGDEGGSPGPGTFGVVARVWM